MDDYTTIFLFSDNAKNVFHKIEEPLIAGVIFGVVFFISLYFKKRSKTEDTFNVGILGNIFGKKTDNTFIAGIIGTVLVGMWVGIFGFVYLYQRHIYSELFNIYDTQQYKIAEGFVRVFTKQPKDSNSPKEVIVVGGVNFEIDNYILTLGYNIPISRGGVLRDGTNARIYYYEKTGVKGVGWEKGAIKKYYVQARTILRIDKKRNN